MASINEAHQVLSDSSKRQLYDLKKSPLGQSMNQVKPDLSWSTVHNLSTFLHLYVPAYIVSSPLLFAYVYIKTTLRRRELAAEMGQNKPPPNASSP